MKLKVYYSFHETADLLSDLGFTKNIFGSLVREKLLHPMIYINSLPALACVLDQDGAGQAVGYCFLSTYWDLGNQIIAVIDTLLTRKSFNVKLVVDKKKLLGEPEIIGWRTELQYFEQVPTEYVSPKAFNENLVINHFILVSSNQKSVNMGFNNIVITKEDFDQLKQYLQIQKEAMLTVHTKTKSRVSPSIKQTRHNALHELIKSLHEQAQNKSAVKLWKELRDLALEGNETVLEVDNWTSHEPKVRWISSRGNENKLERRSFENFISKLKSNA